MSLNKINRNELLIRKYYRRCLISPDNETVIGLLTTQIIKQENNQALR